MNPDDFQKILVGEHQVGVLGLKTVLAELAKTHVDAPDEVVRKELIERLGKKNYISVSSRESYGKAFLREFRKFLGKPSTDEPSESALRVEVLGPGCYQCDALEQTVIRLLNELQLPVAFEHISDIQEITRYGIIRLPALLINGTVVSMGTVPPARKIKEWLLNMATPAASNPSDAE